ncbi:flagellar basal body rod protein FlgB [Roseibium alexandrii]|uniref:Flagellar basal body rod protein FlgB n=1 Tax=Roseibium alexandrii (strain DSM 17067 / NCIMB 14079 / DFL-11) TaxID=244592 RepID=A0A5E8H2U2_ROSAD|nr:flagellar basal body rod protein FlgB [Roseibium alexandrii]EEE46205.2 Flagellar basal body protein [Roseibium alexandrii DFL-11]
MAFTDLPLFQALKSKMQWHQTRQGVLAENIANSDSPEFEARDVKAYSFDDHIGREAFGLTTERTSVAHISGMIGSGIGGKAERRDSFEITPSGNAVNLEEQMMKITQNQMDFQAATTLYTKGLGLIRTALSKTA